MRSFKLLEQGLAVEWDLAAQQFERSELRLNQRAILESEGQAPLGIEHNDV